MTVKVDMKALLEAGAHFGHKTSRWHPKMAPYIHSKRDNAHIINLEKTVEGLEAALPVVESLAKDGKQILFVGTKKQMKDVVKEAAEDAEMPYVNVRWVGGTLTNSATVNRQIKKLKDLERKMSSGYFENHYSKLEVQRFQEEIDALNERYGGIKNMAKRPAALIIIDAMEEKNAIKEANGLNVPVFAMTDTNVDPTNIDFVIPSNDDSIKATKLILGYFVEAIKSGKAKAPAGIKAEIKKEEKE